MVALACDLEMDTMDCCSDATKWAWFTQYCVAARMAKALQNRTAIPVKSVPPHELYVLLLVLCVCAGVWLRSMSVLRRSSSQKSRCPVSTSPLSSSDKSTTNSYWPGHRGWELKDISLCSTCVYHMDRSFVAPSSEEL